MKYHVRPSSHFFQNEINHFAGEICYPINYRWQDLSGSRKTMFRLTIVLEGNFCVDYFDFQTGPTEKIVGRIACCPNNLTRRSFEDSIYDTPHCLSLDIVEEFEGRIWGLAAVGGPSKMFLDIFCHWSRSSPSSVVELWLRHYKLWFIIAWLGLIVISLVLQHWIMWKNLSAKYMTSTLIIVTRDYAFWWPVAWARHIANSSELFSSSRDGFLKVPNLHMIERVDEYLEGVCYTMVVEKVVFSLHDCMRIWDIVDACWCLILFLRISLALNIKKISNYRVCLNCFTVEECRDATGVQINGILTTRRTWFLVRPNICTFCIWKFVPSPPSH